MPSISPDPSFYTTFMMVIGPCLAILMDVGLFLVALAVLFQGRGADGLFLLIGSALAALGSIGMLLLGSSMELFGRMLPPGDEKWLMTARALTYLGSFLVVAGFFLLVWRLRKVTQRVCELEELHVQSLAGR